MIVCDHVSTYESMADYDCVGICHSHSLHHEFHADPATTALFTAIGNEELSVRVSSSEMSGHHDC